MSLETITHCIVCSSENITDFLDCTDHFISNESFTISRCKNCGFCFTNPRPFVSNIAPYYNSEEYISHSKTSAGIINRLFHLSRIYTLGYKKRIVKKYSSGNRILDYGCGTGEFLQTMKNKGWICSGIEPNAGARESANQKFDFKISDEAGISKIAEGSLDAISLWHVLEHVYPIKERLISFHKLLSEKGILFVALPNMDSYDAKRYGKFWAAWDVPRHIYHFNPASIKTLMKNYGFELVTTRPMILDAFYISMLSEKYKNGSPKNFNALLHGIISNCSALMKDKNYSSLIYIFKKSN